ncbi:MAG: hypothetical protein QUS09_02870, partial [Methanotrichaceae archaeon]|nr:hypothetical protein [Methanotrichaceae archaeon]
NYTKIHRGSRSWRTAGPQGRQSTDTPGEKTAARIAAIEQTLKGIGPTTLKELRRMLKISSCEMLRLLKKLDMRRYESLRHPGDARLKVLRLRSWTPNVH